MSYRTFLDVDGAAWQVWDVRPAEAERRVRERRMRHDPTAEERRDIIDRRQRHPRPDLPHELLGGWLVFQSGDVKRRYWPIPGDWQELSVSALRDLCGKAQAVTRGGRSDAPPEASGSGSGSSPQTR